MSERSGRQRDSSLGAVFLEPLDTSCTRPWKPSVGGACRHGKRRPMLGFQGQQGTHREQGRKRGSRLGVQSAGLSFLSIQLARQYPWTLFILFFSPFWKIIPCRYPLSRDLGEPCEFWHEGCSSFYLWLACFCHGERKFHNALINTSFKILKVVFVEHNHNAYFYKTWRQG